jgi:hypothetical protein
MSTSRKSCSRTSERAALNKRWSAALVMAFVGIPSLGFAVVSGLFNASFASSLGNSAHEARIWVLASVLVTVFLTGLPLAIEVLRARVPHLAVAARGLWISALLFSFVSAMGFAAASRGQSVAEATASIRDREAIERAIDRGEAELAALGRHRPSGAIQADIQAVQQSIGLNCSRPARSERVREACSPVMQLRAELAASEDARRLEQAINQQRASLASRAVVASANPQADMLSWIGGGVLSASVWTKLITVFVAGLIELSAALGLAIAARAVVEILREDESQPEQEQLQAVEMNSSASMGADQAFSHWFSTCVGATKGARITPKDAYAHFEAWSGLNNVNGSLAYHTFGRRMGEAVEAIGGKLGNSGGRYYSGVSLAKLGTDGVALFEKTEEAGE